MVGQPLALLLFLAWRPLASPQPGRRSLRRRGALRPHAMTRTRTGRYVKYEIVKSKPRTPADRHNQGGDRGPALAVNASWMEVAHTRDARDPLDGADLWMYRARDGATGVWYFTGPTLQFADTVDLAAHLNASYYDPRDYASKLRLFTEATPELLAAGVETVVFTSHLDACCERRLHEVISLRGAASGCPASPRFRAGPNASALAPCACAAPEDVC